MRDNLLILDPACSKEWDQLGDDLQKQFKALCIRNDWTALFQYSGSVCELSFMSPYPEIEWSVKERNVLRCVQVALG